MDSDFFSGMLTATIIIAALFVAKTAFQTVADADIEDAKVEHLTIKYKNSEHGIADKEMLVNIMKQHFPTSNWSHVDSQAGKNSVELDVWRTKK